MEKKMTHTGFIEGCDARTPNGFKKQLELRETKLHWISYHGLKYKKSSGYGLGDWPRYRLILESIKPIE